MIDPKVVVEAVDEVERWRGSKSRDFVSDGGERARCAIKQEREGR